MKTFTLVSLFTLFLTCQTLTAQGIVLVEQETRDGKASTNRIQIDKTHLRAESHASGENVAFVFDASSQTARMINVDKKTYSELTKAQMEQMRQQMSGASAQMSAAQKQMEEQLKNMSPEQRAMVEQMMRGRGGMPSPMAAPPAAPLQYHQTGSDKVGEWSCTKYDGMRGQEKVMEVCAVDPKALGLTASDFDVAKQFAEFMKALTPQSADQQVIFGTPEQQGFAGVPVRRTTYTNGKVASVSEVKEFRRESIPASTFDVPAGFTKQSNGMRP